jgi:hypothetical protein
MDFFEMWRGAVWRRVDGPALLLDKVGFGRGLLLIDDDLRAVVVGCSFPFCAFRPSSNIAGS